MGVVGNDQGRGDVASARYTRVSLEARERRRLRSRVVRAAAVGLGAISILINTLLLGEGLDHVISVRNVIGAFTLYDVAATYQGRVVWGFLLPGILGGLWLGSLLVIVKAYGGAALHRQWWHFYNSGTPFSFLSPGTGMGVLISRFLLCTAMQGIAGGVIVSIEALALPMALQLRPFPVGVVAIYFAGAAFGLALRPRMRTSIERALRERQQALDAGAIPGHAGVGG